MFLLLRIIYKFYCDLFYKFPDTRTDGFILVNSPLYPLLTVVLYWKFVTCWGPSFMKSRQPYNLDKLIVGYNILQIALCFRLVVKAFIYTYGLGEYSLFCEPINYSNSYLPLTILNGVYSYYIMKNIDLLETIFFVFRKKNKQISFLHVYHHIGMIIATWVGVRYLGGGSSVILGYVNSIVHMFMYTYYLLAALKLKDVNLGKWKQFITLIQLAQFGFLSIHYLLLFIGPHCGYPKFVSALMFPQNMFMLALFVDFYRKQYILK